jgi:hypothetical protein
MELTLVQRDILTALINIYRRENRAVKGEEIAELIDRTPGTIRNQMQSLKSLNLVEGVSGPKGGYVATGHAYEALKLDGTDDTVIVPVVRNKAMVPGASASEILFSKIAKSNECDGAVRIIGNVRDFQVGDDIQVGPMPVNKLYLRGTVVGRDDAMSRILFKVAEVISMPKITVKEVSQSAVHIDPKVSLQEAARILIYNGVREALVDGHPPGLVSMWDMALAIADGRIDLAVGEIASRNFPTVDSKDLLFEAVNILGRGKMNQLAVYDSEMPWGIITPADIIRVLAPARSQARP